MTACGRLSLHRICRLVAQRVVSLRFQCLDAIGVKADIARASRAYQSEAIDPSRHLTINFAVMHNGILTLEVLRCPALKFKGSRNCDRVGSFRSDAKISDCRFDLRVPQ
jgi:hypothetical protein